MAYPAGHKSGILTETGTNELEIITFYLQFRDEYTGGFTKTFFGINAAKVMELIAVPQEITEIAETPEYVEGVFLQRGRTITLIDLCKWFRYEPDFSDDAKTKWTVVVAELNGNPYGFITHGVDKVYRVSWEQISVPPELIARGKSLTGICLVNNQIIQLVDFERIIALISPRMGEEAEAEITAARSALPEGLAGKTVVAAEDSPTILTRLTKILEAARFNVIANSDGQEAWNYLEGMAANDNVLDKIIAVVSDIEMPKMDGHHLCLKIKEHPVLRNIPVILFSSMINDALRRKGITVGADDQITKPEISNIIEHIAACAAKKSKRQ